MVFDLNDKTQFYLKLLNKKILSGLKTDKMVKKKISGSIQ